MSLCSVPFRLRRSAAAAAVLDGCDSPLWSTSSPSSSPRQHFIVRRSASSSSTSSATRRRHSHSHSQFRTRKSSASPTVFQRSVSIMSGKKLNKMRSIVRHWRKLTHASQSRYLSLAENGNGNHGSSSSSSSATERKQGGYESCFFSSSASQSLSDAEEDCSPRSVKHLARSAVTDDVPDGCLALFVGRERRRFVIGMHYLEHNLFRGLLERSAAEFGFDQKGGITIACEVVLFEHLLWLIGTDDPTSRHLQVDELLDFYAY